MVTAHRVEGQNLFYECTFYLRRLFSNFFFLIQSTGISLHYLHVFDTCMYLWYKLQNNIYI